VAVDSSGRDRFGTDREEASVPDITTEQLDEWARLAGEATPGPFDLEVVPEWTERNFTIPEHVNIEGVAAALTPADAAFFISARDAVPALVAEVRRLRDAFERVLGELDNGTSALATLNAVEVVAWEALGQ
jgi:hypothetical protein